MNRNVRNLIVGVVVLVAIGGAVWAAVGSFENGESEVAKAKKNSVSPNKDTVNEEQKEPGELPPPLPQEGPMRGKDLPDLKTLTDREGNPVSLLDNGGKPALINAWASWCPPCREEMPHMQEAYEKHGDQVQFHMLNLITVDSPDQMAAYLEEEGFTFPVVLDEKGEALQTLHLAGIPQTFIVDEHGRVIHHIPGYMQRETLDRIMDELTS